MKGFKAEVGRNKACSFSYFKTIWEASEFISNSIEFGYTHFGMKDFDIQIRETEIEECRCGRLMEATENECLRCKKLRVGD